VIIVFYTFVGIVQKCHTARELDTNRKNARKMLIEKLDDHFNGEMSVKAQIERALMKKSKESALKRKKVQETKKNYKEFVASRENLEKLENREEK